MPNVTLDSSNIVVTLAVILIVLEGLSILSKGIDAWKKITGKDQRTAEMVAVKQRVADLETWKVQVENRLQQGNIRFEENSRDTTEILIVLRSMIKHMQSGNDHQKLQETDDKLYRYLVEKRGVNPSSL